MFSWRLYTCMFLNYQVTNFQAIMVWYESKIRTYFFPNNTSHHLIKYVILLINNAYQLIQQIDISNLQYVIFDHLKKFIIIMQLVTHFYHVIPYVNNINTNTMQLIHICVDVKLKWIEIVYQSAWLNRVLVPP